MKDLLKCSICSTDEESIYHVEMCPTLEHIYNQSYTNSIANKLDEELSGRKSIAK